MPTRDLLLPPERPGCRPALRVAACAFLPHVLDLLSHAHQTASQLQRFRDRKLELAVPSRSRRQLRRRALREYRQPIPRPPSFSATVATVTPADCAYAGTVILLELQS